MTRGSVIIPSVILVAGARALAMSASSFWAGILRCSGTSPAFTIAGTPKGTASLRAMPHRAAAAARPRRRIDRIRSATSEFGTFRTRFRGQSGKHLLVASISPFDPQLGH
jgi:hypothetical protein